MENILENSALKFCDERRSQDGYTIRFTFDILSNSGFAKTVRENLALHYSKPIEDCFIHTSQFDGAQMSEFDYGTTIVLKFSAAAEIDRARALTATLVDMYFEKERSSPQSGLTPLSKPAPSVSRNGTFIFD